MCIIILLINVSCTNSKGFVNVECSYMMYACGEDCAQFRIDSVLIGDSKLKGVDIHIEANQIDLLVDLKECLICYVFSVQGELFYSRTNDSYSLVLDSHSTKLKDNCCD